MADIFMPPAAADSGTQGPQDPTLVSGQDPDSLFGMAISYDSGAGGTAAPGGQGPGGTDPTNQPNQYPDRGPISGVAFGGSGAPGTAGVTASSVDSGGSAIMVSDPNYTAGKPGGGSGIQMVSVQADISGPGDWTASAQNYPPGKPVLPGDFYPADTGAGKGTVRKGGYMNGQR